MFDDVFLASGHQRPGRNPQRQFGTGGRGSGVILEDNTFRDCSGWSVWAETYAGSVELKDNRFRDCNIFDGTTAGPGAQVQMDSVTVTNNTFTSNREGLEVVLTEDAAEDIDGDDGGSDAGADQGTDAGGDSDEGNGDGCGGCSVRAAGSGSAFAQSFAILGLLLVVLRRRFS